MPKGYLRVLVCHSDPAQVSRQTQQLSQAALNHHESLRQQVLLPQVGYVTAYVGNESDTDVFFDGIQIEHRQGLRGQAASAANGLG